MNLSKTFIAGLFMAATTFAHAQDEAPRNLFSNSGRTAHGGWAAPTADHTRILDQDALLVGLRAGWLIDHRITIGLAGKGLVTRVDNAAFDAHLVESGQRLNDRSRFQLGYGGLLIEPIIAYRSPVHVSLPILIGAGGCGYSYNSSGYRDGQWHGSYFDHAKAFLVVEPGVEVELNLVPFLRLGMGISYRYTSEVELAATPNDVLHGLNAGVSLKVGRF
ncbi:MAG: hypothetical protein KDB88_01755 [Flavobacteriales bacterium]|nr:hypothetical protein [Flavobacteriales bacterium]